MDGLFGEEYNIEIKKPKVKDLLKKIKEDPEKATEEVDVEKLLKSKKLTRAERLRLITDKVLTVLGRQRKNTIVIKTKQQFEDYITAAINSGRIDIDTETNNSLDPVTCDLMGLCLYYPDGKQAYIPINHVNPDTEERLAWQLTEADCCEQLQRVVDFKKTHPEFLTVMHNGKFDYEVIKCTCDIDVVPDWDTMIAHRLLNENDLAGLKYIYTKYIDPSQEKYDIDKLFTGIFYKYVDPDIFALYAATDSMMTDKVYLWQKPQMECPESERLFWVFKNIEMPIVIVTAEMELRGVCINTELGKRLKVKYGEQLKEIDAKIVVELDSLKDKIASWKLTPAANERTKQYQPKKTKLSLAEIEEKYPLVDDKMGKRYKIGKAKTEQISDPINLASPVQLAILFYDILKCPQVSKKSPRGTGEEELKAIAEKMPELKICKLILERRGIVKLITTYIDVIPDLSKHWPDGRIRFHLNSLGTDTGRYSSGGKLKFIENNEAVEVSGINIQNIPSRNPEIRLLFHAKYDEAQIEAEDNEPFTIPEISEIETSSGWKFPKDLIQGDKIIIDGVATEYRGRRYLPETREWQILAY